MEIKKQEAKADWFKITHLWENLEKEERSENHGKKRGVTERGKEKILNLSGEGEVNKKKQFLNYTTHRTQ